MAVWYMVYLLFFRFEEVEEQDTELLLPLGSHSVMVLNEQHTMSMLVIFLQLDCTTLERACLLEVFTHLVRERIVTKLRHVVILGHGIGCDIRKLHGNTGLRITVESQFPPSAVNTAVEESLAELEAHLRSLTHADFKVCSAPSVPQPVVQSRRRPLLGPSPG